MLLHVLPDGTRLRIRPVEPGDKPRLAAGLARLSSETVRRRFLAAKPRFSGMELRYLTEVDGRDHLALVAVPEEEPERIVGVARCVRLAPGAPTAEFAIVIGDDVQGLGLGTALTRALAHAAAAAGIERFSATVLAENGAVEHVLGAVAARVEHRPADGGLQELLAELPRAA
jgi:RimJ/RimL family protein N-acetyltransferase